MKFTKVIKSIESFISGHKSYFKIGIIALIFALSFFHFESVNATVCPFKLMTGLPCPGCGLTHSFICLSHGNFIEAIHEHLLGPIVYLYFIIILITSIIELITNKNIHILSKSTVNKLYHSFAFLLCVYQAFRIIDIIYNNQVISLVKSSIICRFLNII